MWVFDKKPNWIGNYWCYLDDGAIEKFRVAANGWWRKLDNPYDYSDTGGREVVAWWDEPLPQKPDNKTIHLT